MGGPLARRGKIARHCFRIASRRAENGFARAGLCFRHKARWVDAESQTGSLVPAIQEHLAAVALPSGHGQGNESND